MMKDFTNVILCKTFYAEVLLPYALYIALIFPNIVGNNKCIANTNTGGKRQ